MSSACPFNEEKDTCVDVSIALDGCDITAVEGTAADGRREISEAARSDVWGAVQRQNIGFHDVWATVGTNPDDGSQLRVTAKVRHPVPTSANIDLLVSALGLYLRDQQAAFRGCIGVLKSLALVKEGGGNGGAAGAVKPNQPSALVNGKHPDARKPRSGVNSGPPDEEDANNNDGPNGNNNNDKSRNNRNPTDPKRNEQRASPDKQDSLQMRRQIDLSGYYATHHLARPSGGYRPEDLILGTLPNTSRRGEEEAHHQQQREAAARHHGHHYGHHGHYYQQQQQQHQSSPGMVRFGNSWETSQEYHQHAGGGHYQHHHHGTPPPHIVDQDPYRRRGGSPSMSTTTTTTERRYSSGRGEPYDRW